MLNDKIIRTCFIISLAGHCFVLAAPVFHIKSSEAETKKEIIVDVGDTIKVLHTDCGGWPKGTVGVVKQIEMGHHLSCCSRRSGHQCCSIKHGKTTRCHRMLKSDIEIVENKTESKSDDEEITVKKGDKVKILKAHGCTEWPVGTIGVVTQAVKKSCAGKKNDTHMCCSVKVDSQSYSNCRRLLKGEIEVVKDKVEPQITLAPDLKEKLAERRTIAGYTAHKVEITPINILLDDEEIVLSESLFKKKVIKL